MLKNLIIISIRSLSKRKFYSLVNILGLAVSITFALLLWIYVTDQNAYDLQYVNADRIYRVNADLNMNGKRDIYSNAPMPIAPTFMDEFPEIEEATRLTGIGGLEIHKGILEFENRKIESKKIFAADPNVFKVFERQFVLGNADKALAEPNAIVITESLAIKLFGTVEALGKAINLITAGAYVKVTGVVKDDSQNTHLPIDAFVSWSTIIGPDQRIQWYGGHVYTYILLNSNNAIDALKAKIPTYYTKFMKEEFDRFHGKADLHFQPLRSIYLSPELVWEAYPHGSSTNMYALSWVILFLLAFAIINYVNLATARASERAAEVGIRKVMGSTKGVLVAQFLTESILLSLLSGILALALCWLLIPNFNLLSGINLVTITLFNTRIIGWLFVACLLIGILAGLYPAFYLSSLKSIESLKGKLASNRKGEILRQVLVTSQYFIAATLVASILLVAQQTTFIKNKDIGYNKNGLVSISMPEDSTILNHIPTIIEKLKANSYVLGATSPMFPLDKEANHFSPTLQNPDGTTFQTGVDFIVIDHDFIQTMGAEMLIGRSFNQHSKADEKTFLINETAMRQFGWEKNTLAARFKSWTSRPGDGDELDLIGVVKDFSMGVSYAKVGPSIMFLDPSGGPNLYVRIPEHETINGVEAIRQLWADTFPGYNFEFNFLDNSLNALYAKEDKFLNLLTVFSFVILFIASLGIIGLISFTTVLRRKELAVRKVLGSPVRAIITLLSKRFVRLILLANLLAAPITWYIMRQWLDHFTYRIDFGPQPFAIALLMCILFTLISLCYHTWKAATENPVEALRSE